jgi:hypothetical protein
MHPVDKKVEVLNVKARGAYKPPYLIRLTLMQFTWHFRESIFEEQTLDYQSAKPFR